MGKHTSLIFNNKVGAIGCLHLNELCMGALAKYAKQTNCLDKALTEILLTT